MNRRVALGLLGGAAVATVGGLGWSRRSPDGGLVDRLAAELGVLATRDVPRWLHPTLASGISPVTVLEASMLAGVRRCTDQGDLHSLLLAGPADRLLTGASEPDRSSLLLWVLLHASEWMTYGEDCTAEPPPTDGDPAAFVAFRDAVERREPDLAANALCRLGDRDGAAGWREALALAASLQLQDPHPTIYASEVAWLGGRFAGHQRAALLASVARRLAQATDFDPGRQRLVDEIEQDAALLASQEGATADRDDVAAEVARLVLGGGPELALAGVMELAVRGVAQDAVWEGIWVAATSGAGESGTATNGVHAATVTHALQRLGRSAGSEQARWATALTAVARLAADGPVVVLADAERAWSADPTEGPLAWRSRGLHPGSDMHDLKYAEAIATGASTLTPAGGLRVASLARAGRPAEPEPWPVLDEARAVWDEL